MDLRSGNSGSKLKQAIVKTGLDCQQEGDYCLVLGENVCPEVFGFVENGYVMEALQPAHRYPGLLQDIVELLSTEVWHKKPFPVSTEKTWIDHVSALGVKIPDWVETDPCRVHGDPSVSNCLARGHRLVICDPRPPRAYVPQFKETDMAVVLQSYYGWEEVVYGWHHVEYKKPFFFATPRYMRRAMFWLGVKALRLRKYEKRLNRPEVLNWCSKIEELTGIHHV